MEGEITDRATTDGSITDLFCALVAVPSPSGRELAVASMIGDWLAREGVQTRFDGTGELNDSDAGNLIATVEGAPGAQTYLFVAHMDTVETGATAIEPVMRDGTIRSAGDTILGADNKSAVAATMVLCREAARMPADRRPTLIAAFTSREETGRMGASVLDLRGRAIDVAFCVDGSHPIGTVIDRSLGQTAFNLTIQGRRAHAAMNPQAGVNAIAVAGEIVSALPLGRQEGGGSLGIASIVGGAIVNRMRPQGMAELRLPDDADGPAAARAAIAATPTNSVPDVAVVRGEARGYTTQEIEATLAVVAQTSERICTEHGARCEWRPDCDHAIPPMPGGGLSPGLALVRAAAAGLAIPVNVHQSASTLEANHLARLGDTVAIASGGRDPHQTSESIEAVELEHCRRS